MKRLDLLGVQAFISIAESGSFGAAAAYLHISQTALTRRLQKLESGLGVELIQRTTRSMTVTRAGMDFLPKAIRNVRELAAALDELKIKAEQNLQSIVIGCLPTIAATHLTPIIREYGQRNPRSKVQIFDRSATEIREAVLQGEVDFAVCSLDFPIQELLAEPLFAEPLVAACPSTHRFAKLTSLRWKELEGESLIGIGMLSGNRRQTEQIIAEENLDLRFAFEVQHLATAVGMVCGGAGIAVLPVSALNGISTGQLAAIPLAQPSVVRQIYLLHRRDRPLSSAALTVSKMVIKSLGQATKAARGKN